MSGYRIAAHGVEHVDESGTSCGTLVPQEVMPRAGEYGGPIVCAACGDAVAVPASVERKIRAIERAYQRSEEQGEAQARELARLAAAGVDVAKLPVPAKPKPRRRARQIPMFPEVRRG